MDVAKILQGRNIFISGATGFIGICLLEKILRATDVGEIYLMIRPKRPENIGKPKDGPKDGKILSSNWRQKSVDIRLNELFENSRFDVLRSDGRLEELKAKCHALPGDLTSLKLGVVQSDRDLLKAKFSGGNGLCIHVAADTRFDNPINKSIAINVHGTSQILDLCEEIGVVAFVHTSTLYVNSREHLRARIYEKLYDLEFDPIETYQQWSKSSSHLSEEYGAKLLSAKHDSSWPNTYCLTKSMAEHVVTERCKFFGPEKRQLPLSIMRLGIVASAMKEGFGWFHGSGGFLQLFISIGRRILTIFPNDGDCWPDNVPVDICTNAMIASAAKLLKSETVKESSTLNTFPQIYHIGTADLHPEITLKSCFEAFSQEQTQRIKDGNPLPGLRNCKVRLIPTETRFWFEFFILYDLPYHLLRPFSLCSSRIKGLTNLLDKCRLGVRKFLGLYARFLKSRWIHDMTNTMTLWKELSSKSQSEFDFNTSDQNLEKFMIKSGIFVWYKKIEEQKMKKAKVVYEDFGLHVERFQKKLKFAATVFSVLLIAVCAKPFFN